jgi:transposase
MMKGSTSASTFHKTFWIWSHIPPGQIWQYKNSKAGITKTVHKLKVLNLKLIVMEATGGLEKPLCEAI